MSLQEPFAAEKLPSNARKQSAVPVRLGLVGLGRIGIHHLERLSLRTDLDVVATHDSAPQTEFPQARVKHFHADWRDMLRDDRVEIVLIATHPRRRARLAIDSLEAGKHVLVESPMCANSDEFQAMCAAAQRAGRVLSVSAARTESEDFRTALSLVKSGELGHITAARLMIWEHGVGRDLRSAATDWETSNRNESVPLLIDAATYIDQLLRLIAAPPSSVLAHIGRDGIADGRPAYSILIHFADSQAAGADGKAAAVRQTGLLERNLACLASVNTGWVLDGTGGGYRNFRRYVQTEAGEIFDIPVTPVSGGWDSAYEAFKIELQETQPVSKSAIDGGRTVRVLEAALESARQCAVIPLL